MSSQISVLDEVLEGKSAKKIDRHYLRFCFLYLFRIKQTRETQNVSRITTIVFLHGSKNHATSQTELFAILVLQV